MAEPTLALLGLGPMGLPIATRLGEAGVRASVWNRTPGRVPALPSLRAATSPADAAADIVVTVLPDLDQVEEVLAGPTGLIAGWEERGIADPILVVHGTVSPDRVAAEATRLHAAHGIRLVDAPMSGGTLGAAAGTLTLMVGGDADTVAEVHPVFAHYSRSVGHFGPVGSGSLGKACNQIVVASTVAAIAEAVTLARASGLDLPLLLGLMADGLAGSEVLRQKASKWLDDDYAEGGSATNQLKDLRFARAAAERAGVDLPVTSQVGALFGEMVERGDGALDHTGVVRTIAARGPRRTDPT